MVDHLSPEKRSWNMAQIRAKNTLPEKITRSLLHRRGYRFRLHGKNIPGRPDIVLPKYKTVIFVHGCFWHRCKKCNRATIPSTRQKFWLKKFEDNVNRDARNKKELKKSGWKVIVIWECETNNLPELQRKLLRYLGNS